MTAALVSLSLLLGALPQAPPKAPSARDLAPLEAAFPGCPAGTRHCVRVNLHVTVVDGRPVASAAWLRAELERANRLFAPIGVGFERGAVRPLPASTAHIRTRGDRDRLGRDRFERGVVDVFVVDHLDNVDESGEIGGVHWRDRKDTKRRWVILTPRVFDWVLAHELGHFFGLPHSTHRRSVMNKYGAAGRPPADTWEFVAAERRRMTARLKRMLTSGFLRSREVRRPRPGPGPTRPAAPRARPGG